LTQTQNTEISALVKKVLLLISDHLVNENCLKVIEYLLRNYKIHQFESEQCIIYFMQFHSLPSYIRLLQNLNLTDVNHWTHFLNDFAKKGGMVSRDLIINQILYDPSLMDRIINYVKDLTALRVQLKANQKFFVVSGQPLGSGKALGAANSPGLSFLTAVIIEATNSSLKKSPILSSQIQRIS
jgi:hypothetical protein